VRRRWTKIGRLILSAALAASALVGIEILSTDFWLWSGAPTHAYGLIAFVALDTALIFGIWRAVRSAVFGALLASTIQLASMLGDMVTGQPAGTPAEAFRRYLLDDASFIGLLVIQGLIISIAVGTWALPHLRGHWLASWKTIKQ
jgi:hypothetical protein